MRGPAGVFTAPAGGVCGGILGGALLAKARYPTTAVMTAAMPVKMPGIEVQKPPLDFSVMAILRRMLNIVR
jgi:hypothetical protein